MLVENLTENKMQYKEYSISQLNQNEKEIFMNALKEYSKNIDKAIQEAELNGTDENKKYNKNPELKAKMNFEKALNATQHIYDENGDKFDFESFSEEDKAKFLNYLSGELEFQERNQRKELDIDKVIMYRNDNNELKAWVRFSYKDGRPFNEQTIQISSPVFGKTAEQTNSSQNEETNNITNEIKVEAPKNEAHEASGIYRKKTQELVQNYLSSIRDKLDFSFKNFAILNDLKLMQSDKMLSKTLSGI